MKPINHLISLISVIMISHSLSAQQHELTGAWELEHQKNQQTLVFANGYWSFTEFNIGSKTFVGTIGGSYEYQSDNFNVVVEYNTLQENTSYQPMDGKVTVSDQVLQIGPNKWERVDDGTPGELPGAWLITGRERGGVMNSITPGARKTMKILSGTRFQWIAYNSETMQFMGTGGGTYTTQGGKYTEHIEFFSRDASRVGASLVFDFQLKENDWHHKGKSSKGQPIYEIWSLR